MRKEVLKEVRQQFSDVLRTELDDFRNLPATDLSPGADLYVKKIAPDFSVFICLVPNNKAYRDSFMIELGWGRSEQLGEIRFSGKERIDPLEDGTIRLPLLWREKWASRLEPWWETGNSLSLDKTDEYYSAAETKRRLSRVPPLVHDAVQKIKEYGVPLFKAIAAARGHSEVGL
jgi:hypothetical protein